MNKPTIQYYTGEEDLKEMEDGYIIAGDGIYLKSTTTWFTNLSKVDGISSLEEIGEENTYLLLGMPDMPFGIIRGAWHFFLEVYEKYKAEAITILCYTEEDGYYLEIPEQTVSGASLDYEMGDIQNVVGTIHSHADMSAFHSSTDTHDELNFDGIHITLGNVDESFPSISSSVMKNKQRYMTNLDDYVDYSKSDSTLDFKNQMDKVTKRHGHYKRKKKKSKVGGGYYGNLYSSKEKEEDDNYVWNSYPKGCGGDFSSWGGF